MKAQSVSPPDCMGVWFKMKWTILILKEGPSQFRHLKFPALKICTRQSIGLSVKMERNLIKQLVLRGTLCAMNAPVITQKLFFLLRELQIKQVYCSVIFFPPVTFYIKSATRRHHFKLGVSEVLPSVWYRHGLGGTCSKISLLSPIWLPNNLPEMFLIYLSRHRIVQGEIWLLQNNLEC